MLTVGRLKQFLHIMMDGCELKGPNGEEVSIMYNNQEEGSDYLLVELLSEGETPRFLIDDPQRGET